MLLCLFVLTLFHIHICQSAMTAGDETVIRTQSASPQMECLVDVLESEFVVAQLPVEASNAFVTERHIRIIRTECVESYF